MCPRLNLSFGARRAALSGRKRGPELRRGRHYNSRRWGRLRLMVLAEHPICQHPGCREPATDVHHIVDLAQGGDDSMENLQALCHSHHSKVTRSGQPDRDAHSGGAPNGTTVQFGSFEAKVIDVEISENGSPVRGLTWPRAGS